MNVSSVPHAIVSPVLLDGRHPRLSREQAVRDDSRPAPLTQDADTTTPIAPPDPSEPIPAPASEDEAKGVLRLLEAGHFKGVADVRLRINFFEELSAQAAADAVPAAVDGVEDLLTTMRATIATFADAVASSGTSGDESSSEALVNLTENFETQVESLIQDLTTAGSVDEESLESAIRASFEEFLGGLAELFAPPADAPPAPIPDPEPVEPPVQDGDDSVTETTSGSEAVQPEDAVPSEPQETTPVPDVADEPTFEQVYDEALTSLKEAFEAALAELLSSLDGTLRLGEPSAPAGNGGAYDKFLAIYNQLRGGGSSVDQQA